jgi:Ala-tRNA(Pro) deacylase
MTTMSKADATVMPGLLEWLEREHVGFELHRHAETFTAAATARAEHVDPRTFAKVVGVRVHGGRWAMLVLDAADRVDLAKAEAALGAGPVELLTEAELAAIAPGCEAGALPAVGRLFGLEMIADHAVGEEPEISFNGGTHRCTVRVDRKAWERATAVRYAGIAEREWGPAWAQQS